MTLRTSAALFSLALLAGCTSGDSLDDGRFATGSSTLAADRDFANLYAVNTDAGSLSRSAPGSTDIDELDLGVEPTRVARAGDKLFVTLRGERNVAVVALTDAGPVLEDKIAVGAEPFGIVADEKGDKVFVAVSQANTVHQINARNHNLTRTWQVPFEPRFIALHPSGKNLYVASVRGEGKLWSIDLREGKEEEGLTEIPLPTIERLDEDGNPVEITGRITGDMSVSSDGSELVVPVVYVDNKNPVEDPTIDGEFIVPVQDGYGGGGAGSIDRFNPGVVVVDVKGGEPDPESGEAVFVSGFLEDFRSEMGITNIRSYPSSVTISPDGITYYVTFEGSEAIGVVGALPFQNQDRNDVFFGGQPEPAFDGDFCCDDGFEGGGRLPFTDVNEGGFSQRPKVFVRTSGWAPTGVAFLSEDDAWVHESMSRAVAHIDAADTLSAVKENGKSGFDDSFRQFNTDERSPTLAAQVLPNEVFEGRRLFYTATNSSMAANGAGVSCATCHTDGRNDGLTWTFDSGLRQTPSLAGAVSQTEPVTWTDEVASVSHEANITTRARMGGGGLTETELANIAAYVEWTRTPDTPMQGETSEASVRGKALFERDDVGCASCHTGEALTDNEHHQMFGLDSVNTPTLVGIAGSGPYLHDGRADSLRAVLEWSTNGDMGNTSMLSSSEMDDLEAYLHTL